MSDISCSVRKVDSLEKMSGQAKYVSDIKMDGMLFAKTVRATISKGKIIDIKLPKLPEGYFMVDYKDIPGRNFVKIIFEEIGRAHV